MWALYPFLEANQLDKVKTFKLYRFIIVHYFTLYSKMTYPIQNLRLGLLQSLIVRSVPTINIKKQFKLLTPFV
jgi:hypothetical protein